MAETTLQIQPRETGGSPTARAVRRQGLVPGILYGRGREPYPFQIDVPTLREALSGEAGRHAILQVSVPGESAPTPAILKDFQLDLVRDRLTHLDLLAISMTEKITTTVAVHVEGDAPGVVDDGGVLEQPVHEIEVSALPGDVPNVITVDISSLATGDTIKLGDLTPPSGVEWATDPETVLATILQPTTMEDIEAEAAEEGEGVAEGEAPAEGEAGPAEDAGGESESE
jgi:large subunit ribosomal protein L25